MYLRSLMWGGLVLWLAIPPTAAAQIQASEFDALELRELEQGELVTRPSAQLHHGLRLFGGTSWQVVDTTPKRVWRALLDVPRYRHMLPKAVAARTLARTKDQRTVEIRHLYGPFDVSYQLKFKVRPARRDISFRLQQSNASSLKTAWGFISVSPFGAKRSIISYGVFADIGTGSLQSWARPLLQEKMLKIPFYIKRYMQRHALLR